MSIALLQSVGAWIDAAGLGVGYTRRYFRYSDSDLLNGPVMQIRNSGAADAGSNIQVRFVDIMVIDGASSLTAIKNEADAIESLARSTTYPAGAIKCRVLSAATDPIPMENDLFYCMLRIEVTL